MYRLKKNNDDQQHVFILSFVQKFLMVTIWIFLFIAVLWLLGFNVGAILAGLGIGGLEIAFAAKETLSNLMGGITIFIERPFSIGDVVRVGNETPQKVVNMTWRSVTLMNSSNYYTHVPNSQASGLTLINYTQILPTHDFIEILVSPEYDAQTVLNLTVKALDQCGTAILQDERKDTEIRGLEAIGDMTLMRYRVRYYLAEYQGRGGKRSVVWLNVKKTLEEAGIVLKVNKTE